MAIGHKQVTALIEQDRIENPGGDALYTESDARKMGLLWSRRKGAEKREGFILTQREEETEEEAVEAGRQMRANLTQTLRQIPDLPDRYNPEEASGPSRRPHSPQREENTTRQKYRRVQFSRAVSDDELSMDPLESMEFTPDREVLEARAIVQATSDSIVNLDQLFSAVQDSAISSSQTQDRNHTAHHNESSSLELGAYGGRGSTVKREHGFLLDEAEEINESAREQDDPNSSFNPVEDSRFHNNPDIDSFSNLDAEDSFVVDNDCFE